MFKVSTRLVNILAVLTLFYPNNLTAMIDASEEDVRLSRKNFLISGAPYDENDKSKGAITLCFKTVKSTFGLIDYEYEHAALVFEMFFPASPNDVSVFMIHYGGEKGCCGGKNMRPWLETPKSTLSKIYREVEENLATGEKRSRSAKYMRYASWVLPNDNLIKGYLCAEADSKAHENNPKLLDSYDCITYGRRIMKKVGLSKVDFGLWIRKADNLRRLADDYVIPKPDYTKYREISLELNVPGKSTPLHSTEKKERPSIIRPAVASEPTTPTYASLLLNAAIQNEHDRPSVAIHQYAELVTRGVFDDPSK